jgi:hypothetical protein
VKITQTIQQLQNQKRTEAAQQIAYRKSVNHLKEYNISPFFVLAALPFASLHKGIPKNNRRKR